MGIRELTYRVIGAAMRVHSHFGPGFLEEVYQNALAGELGKQGLAFAAEVPLSVEYEGVCIGRYQADIIVENRLVLELKAVEALNRKHEAQLVHYLTATGIDDGLLLNFGASSLQCKHKYRLPAAKAASANPVNPADKTYLREKKRERQD